MPVSMLDDRYRIESEAGAGAFGTVYRATQRTTNQAVAIKVLHQEHRSSAHGERSRKRFERELELCARLHHPNIVRLIDSGSTPQGAYVVFEWVPGVTLAELLATEGPLRWSEARHLMSQVLDALACAHGNGIVHRDLKPHNIMVAATGVRRNAVVLDFGIGALSDGIDDAPDRLTRSQEVVGTPAYAAPEQLRGERATTAADLYAWALTFAECLSGRRVVQGRSLQAIWYEQLRPEPLVLPAMLGQHPVTPLLRRTLERDVARRSHDAGTVLAELDALDTSVELATTRDQRPSPESGSQLGEYRQVTTVCARVVLPTATDGAALEERADLVRRHRRSCEAIARRLDGRVHEVFGDRLALCFGYPVVSEDAVTRALRTALEIRELHLHHVAIGVHTAVIVLDDANDDPSSLPMGNATEVAGELAYRAAPGEVLCSGRTHAIAAPSFDFDESADASAFRVRGWLGHKDRHRSHEPPFEGRRPELDHLRSWVSDAMNGRGQAVVISGEPGVGKSRLVDELEADPIAANVTWVRTHGVAHADAPGSHGLSALLFALLEIPATAPPSDRRDALRALLDSTKMSAPQHVTALSELLGVPIEAPEMSTPEQRCERSRTALLGLLTQLSADAPLVLVVDDLQWCDSATFEFLGELLTEVTTLPLLVVLLTRPQLEPPWPSRQFQHLRLERLTPVEARAIVEWVSGGRLRSQRLIVEIVRQGDGIPLFLEQLTRMVVERLASVDGEVTDSADLVAGIPPGLRDALCARLDRMGAAKDAALTASILGPSFGVDLLARVLEIATADVERTLAQLVDAGILLKKRGRDGWSYRYRHALLREAAHESLLEAARRRLHARVAAIIVADRSTSPDQLAYHYSQAGAFADALPFAVSAAEAALTRSANIEAIAHVHRARSWLGSADPAQRSALALKSIGLLIPALLATEGYAAAEVPALVDEARTLASDANSIEAFHALRASCLYHHARGELSVAIELGRKCLVIATPPERSKERASIRVLLAQCAFVEGRFDDADVHLDEVLAEERIGSDPASAVADGHDVVSGALVLRAMIAFMRGRSTVASTFATRALDRAQELGHHNSTAGVLAYVGGLHHYRRDRVAVEVTAEQLITFAERHSLSQWRALGGLLQAWCRGDVQMPAKMLEGLRAMGVRLAWPYWSSTVAESELRGGLPEAAVLRSNEAIAVARSSGERYYLPELLRLSAEAQIAMAGDPRDISAQLHEAIDVAENMGSPVFALRAALTLHDVDATYGHALVARLRAALPLQCKEPEAHSADRVLANASRGRSNDGESIWTT